MIIQNARIFIANEIVISQGHFLRKIQLFRFFNNDIIPQRAKSVKNLIFQKFLFHINYFLRFAIMSRQIAQLRFYTPQN